MTKRSAARSRSDDLRPEYDLSKLKGGVRGKYYRRATEGATLVLLEPDVAEAFPDGDSVNSALRALLELARLLNRIAGAAPKRPAERRQPRGARRRT